MQCPICGNENKESLCPLCGYDLSLCRERWPTPADDGRRPDSIRKLRARRAWERPEGQSAPAQPQPEAYPTQPQPAAYPTQPQPAAYPTQPQPAEYRPQPQPAEYRPQPHSDPAPAASSRSVEAKKKSGSRMKLILAAAALGVLLLGVVLIVVLSGKNGDSGSETASGADALASGSPAQTEASQTEASQTEEEPAVKVNHINRNEKDGLKLDNGWIVYNGDDGRKGLISLDGKVDTGAVYSRVSCYDADAEVTTDSSAITTDPASLNRYGLLNGAGELVLPEAYARFKLCGRYVVAYQVTEITADSTHALCKFAKDSFSKTQTDDVYYNGTWTVFDRKTGAFVPGLSGTREPSAHQYGDYISYQKYNAEGKWQDCVVGPDGTELPGDATLLENGTYVLREPGSAAVYRSDGSVVFEYDPTAFSVCFQPAKNAADSGAYVAKMDTTDGTRYARLDENGAVDSAEFSQSFRPAGPFLLLYDNTLVRPDGTKLTEEKISEIYSDARGGCFQDKAGNTSFFDSSGTILLTVGSDETAEAYLSAQKWYAYQPAESGNPYYCFRTGEYSLQNCDSAGHWLLAQKNAGGSRNLVDSLSGETLLSGYQNYYSICQSGGVRYVVAEFSDNNTWDVFRLR